MGAEKELLQARLTMLRCVQPENDEEMGKWVDLAVLVARNQHADGHLVQKLKLTLHVFIFKKYNRVIFY